MSKKIQDNESIKPVLELTQFIKFGFNTLDKVPFIYKLKPELKMKRDQIMEIINRSDVLTLPDQFNDLFSKDGWICYGDLNQKILEESVSLGLTNKTQEAKELLINYVDERMIDWIIKKCSTRKHFIDRLDLLELLKIDYLEERYHACIPLLLALIDGLANDVSKHIGFFAEKSDFELYDSITSHETGLPFLKSIMNSSRTKTTTEKVLIPYRNGILHGRDLNFANKEVASKCWWLLDCLITWSDEKSLNKKQSQQLNLKETLEKYQKTQEYSKRIDNWKKRPTFSEDFWKAQTLEVLDPNSPEYTLNVFLKGWKEKQWGKMTPLLLHNIGKHQGKSAGDVKNTYQNFELLNFHIISSTDNTSSSTEISTYIEYMKHQEIKDIYLHISLNYANSIDGLNELRGEANGKWYILQLSLRDLIFS